jgi:hypothetical protein
MKTVTKRRAIRVVIRVKPMALITEKARYLYRPELHVQDEGITSKYKVIVK